MHNSVTVVTQILQIKPININKKLKFQDVPIAILESAVRPKWDTWIMKLNKADAQQWYNSSETDQNAYDIKQETELCPCLWWRYETSDVTIKHPLMQKLNESRQQTNPIFSSLGLRPPAQLPEPMEEDSQEQSDVEMKSNTESAVEFEADMDIDNENSDLNDEVDVEMTDINKQ